ncbi:MAG TPA: aldo/keto reductase [Candidatus Elarobacter sp.]|jgi:aryl-alcohol dehydrogenase-like predicted oxidoreductase|nr:aldo/keto reductase [Candidatus Elarobacter sp.]
MVTTREIAPGVAVSAIGFGGYHLGQMKDEAEGIRLLHAAIDAGITFLDNAWEYNEHVSEERMGKALASGNRRDRVFLMTKVCTHGRGKDVALKQLDESLRRLRTDHLDLWQVHECVYDDDPARHYAKGGVLEALDQAKRDGKVRFVGFTGHKLPSIHREMIERGYPFDTAQMPLNVLDPNYRSFEKGVLPLARERGIKVLGMKAFAEGRMVEAGGVDPDDALRYAMSLPGVLSTITGIDSQHVLDHHVRIATDFTPLDEVAMQALREKYRDRATDGHLELYKSTAKNDADEGRAQHHFPPMNELAM